MSVSASSCQLLFILLSLVLVWTSQSDEVKCHQEDKRVLLNIQRLLNIHDTWTSVPDCCSWVGVICDDTTNRVTSLAFLQNGVHGSGQIPEAIGDLPYLQTLIFHKQTNLSGPIPPSITKLKYLNFLDISWVSLTGTIPDFLGQLKNLTYLNLSYNNLTGTIPSSLSLIPKLSYINLSRNKLTGTIPSSLVNLKGNDLYLILSHNQLSGKIPASLGEINFREIDLSRNKLEGDISMLFGYKKTTDTMDFSRNMFEFNMSKLQIHKSLSFFDINHNRVYGSIPKVMTELQLQSFNVSYNRLCGMIPQGGNLQTRFDYSAFFHNRCLCGSPLNNLTC